MLNLYNCITSAAYAVSYPWLKKKYTIGFDERRGIYTREKSLDNAVWVHAVSVGEVQAALPFLSVAKNDPLVTANGIKFLLSTTTATGTKFAEQLNAKYDAHIYYPWDVKRFITRSLDCLKPLAYISVETEIWPMMLEQLKRRNIPAFLINGRISDRSFQRMSKTPSFWKSVFSCFNFIMVRDEQDAYRLESLGVSNGKISVTGDCKIDAMLERKAQCASVQYAYRPVGNRSSPIFIAGSTHPGEEETVIEAFKILREKVSDAKLIIVPRHPERANEVGILAAQTGKTVYYSEFEDYKFMDGEGAWEFLIVDKIGALFCLYSIAESAFIGGSLVPKGGQNIMEPALFGIPVCHGNDMSDFRRVSEQFGAMGISMPVNTAEEMAGFWMQSLNENFKRKVESLSESWFTERSGAAAKCWDIVRGAALRSAAIK